MSVAVTFGSVGDIISICQVAVELWHALGMGGAGAAAEYREVRQTLDRFVRILTFIVATHEQRDQVPGDLASLDQTVKQAVDECGSLIQATLDRVTKRYSENLGEGGSGNRLKASYKKVEFTLRERKELENLRRKLAEGTATISLISTVAARQSARRDTATILARIDLAHQEVRLRQDRTRDLLALATRDQTHRFQSVEGRLLAIERGVNSLMANFQCAIVALSTIGALLRQLAQGVLSIQAVLLSWIALRSLRLDTTTGLPVYLEDALGNVLTIPVEWLYEWQDFDLLLELRFRKLKGCEKVQKRQYALEEEWSGKDVDRTQPLTACLRRGMKINMSMIFLNMTMGFCPRCNKPTDAPEGKTVQCETERCGMWFRVTKACGPGEKVDDDDADSGPSESDSSYRSNPAATCKPSDFQRVRLLLGPQLLEPQLLAGIQQAYAQAAAQQQARQARRQQTNNEPAAGTSLSELGQRSSLETTMREQHGPTTGKFRLTVKKAKKIWYCGKCGEGPWDYKLDTDCPSCEHERDSHCEVHIIEVAEDR